MRGTAFEKSFMGHVKAGPVGGVAPAEDVGIGLTRLVVYLGVDVFHERLNPIENIVRTRRAAEFNEGLKDGPVV
jgi:hypothetical protein